MKRLMFCGWWLALGYLSSIRAEDSGKSPTQLLQEVKAKNQLVIESQSQTRKKLEEVAKQAQELKVFAKRT
ncbi:MAG: hypothetical protein NTX04_09960 [Verrucomicrobia bacterium]|nr:hypothetical protein [Verrucomicrobiota bacterium]